MKVSFDEPSERRTMAGGRVTVEVARAGALPVLRVSHAPGWRWSEHTAPEVGAERCPGTHVGVMVAGRMAVEEADGARYEAGAGDAVVIGPGHDAWTVGEEPAVLVQFDEGAAAAERFGLG